MEMSVSDYNDERILHQWLKTRWNESPAPPSQWTTSPFASYWRYFHWLYKERGYLKLLVFSLWIGVSWEIAKGSKWPKKYYKQLAIVQFIQDSRVKIGCNFWKHAKPVMSHSLPQDYQRCAASPEGQMDTGKSRQILKELEKHCFRLFLISFF